jgi:GcrA cell cycle regulator
MDWTDDDTQKLRTLWAEGHSTAEIGRRMGVSKNAIVGKAHRLDLPGRPSPIRRSEVGAPRIMRSRQPPVPRLADMMPLRACRPLAIEPAAGAPAARAEQHPVPMERRLTGPVGTQPCCWPVGEPGKPGFRFCPNLALLRRPYCAKHCGDAYRPLPSGGGGHHAEADLR